MILLDTCALLWLAIDQKKLSVKAKKTIEQNADALFVSAITALEIGVKHNHGKLSLPLPVLDWFSEALDFHGIKEFHVTSGIAIGAAQLPLIHNDPFDRIIIATAQMNAMRILTPDENIAKYKHTKVIW